MTGLFSFAHERPTFLLVQFVVSCSLGLRLPLSGSGSMTLHREALDKGAEPDASFYLANEPMVRGRKRLDLTIDPPPDLAIEVDFSQSSLDRRAIYAALGVGEFWWLDDGTLLIYELDPNGDYRAVEVSHNLPTVTRSEIQGWLHRAESIAFTEWFLAIQDWARETVRPRLGERPNG